MEIVVSSVKNIDNSLLMIYKVLELATAVEEEFCCNFVLGAIQKFIYKFFYVSKELFLGFNNAHLLGVDALGFYLSEDSRLLY